MCRHVAPNRVVILQMVADGYTIKQIAARYGLHRRTIDHYIGELCNEWEVPNKTVAVARAMLAGLIR